jgi:hypothetical protein
MEDETLTTDGGLRDGIRDELAALAHAQWSGWMRHLFSKCRELPDGSLAIPPALVARWARQMVSDYEALPEQERKSDRVEADKVIGIFNKALCAGALRNCCDEPTAPE